MAQKRNKLGDAEKTIFSEGCLVILKVRKWMATSKLDEDLISDALPKEMVRAVYDILDDKTLIQNLSTLHSRAKSLLYRYSLPFNVDGIVFVHKRNLSNVDEQLKILKGQYTEVVEELANQISDLEKAFSEKYPNLYNPSKYPTPAGIKSRCTFEYSFRQFSLPDKEMNILDPEIYKEEVERFKRDLQEVKRMSMNVMCKEILKRIDSLKEQCSGGNINTATVESVHKLLEKFDNVWTDVVDHDDLKKAIDDIRLYMDGTDAEMLRADDDFRGMVREKMASISKEINLVSPTLERAIDL